MKLSIGIVGLPNVGKSALFHLLTKKEVTVANYPFATIDPNVGIVSVPDERLEKLAHISASKKTIPAIVEFYDIAGLVQNANKGEGLGNQFLAHIREVTAIVHVVRCFSKEDIIHVEQTVDPLRDIGIVNTELALKDIETIEKHLEKLTRDARSNEKDRAKSASAAIPVLENARAMLAKGELLIEQKDQLAIQHLQLLTAKPQIYLLNGTPDEVSEELKNAIVGYGAEYIITNLEEKNSIPELIKRAYHTLNCISFFTTGEDEAHAWTIVVGVKAPEAAGVIHTDFEKNFIKAEVVSYDDFIAADGWNGAKTKGGVRLEGKEYVIKDGDILIVKHG